MNHRDAMNTEKERKWLCCFGSLLGSIPVLEHWPVFLCVHRVSVVNHLPSARPVTA